MLVLTWITIFLSIWWIHTLGSQRVGGGSLLVCSGGGQGKKKKKAFYLSPFFFSIGLYPFKSDPIRKKEEKAAFPFFSMEKEEDRRSFLGHKKAFKNIYFQRYLTKKFVLRRRIFSLEFLRLILGDQREGIPPPPRKWEGRIWSQHHHPTTDTFKTTFLRRTKSRLSNSRFEPKERRIDQLYHCWFVGFNHTGHFTTQCGSCSLFGL